MRSTNDNHGNSVLIAQPGMSGHRFNYVKMLIHYANTHGMHASLLTSDSGLDEYSEKAGRAGALENIILTCSDYVRDDELVESSRLLNTNLVLVPEGDRLIPRIAVHGWRGAGCLRILAMREFAQPMRIPGASRLKSLVRLALFKVASLRKNVDVVILASSVGTTTGCVSRVRDPIEVETTNGPLERPMDLGALGDGVFWFLIAGVIDERKNVPLVLRALSMAAERTPAQLGLILAGAHSPDVRDLVLARSPIPSGYRLVSIDRHLSEGELNDLVRTSEVVVVAHSNEGPSGILGKGAATGTRIVAAGARSLRRDCAALGDGATWCRLSAPALSKAFVAAASCAAPKPALVATPSEFCARLLGS